MADSDKSKVREFSEKWAPLVVALCACVYTWANVEAQVRANATKIETHGAAVKSIDTLVIQHQVLIKHNEKEIDRLRARGDK